MSDTPTPSLPSRGEGEGCFGCFNDTGYIERHDAYFIDTRTGRRFCAECVVVLATWELDGCPEPDERSYTEWVDVGVNPISKDPAVNVKERDRA